MSGRPWTKRETSLVCKHYKARGCAWVAGRLGRSLSSVHQHAKIVGAHAPQQHAYKQVEPHIRELHAKGWSDAEIASHVGKLGIRICRESVSFTRRRLGLGHNRLHPRQRQRVSEATQRQCAAVGVRSLAEVRRLAYDKFALEHGWPKDMAPREVQMLDALYAKGPMTRRELCEATGMPWRGRGTFGGRVPGHSFLAHLQQRGLVVKVYKKKVGRWAANWIYSLAPVIAMERAARDKTA